MKKLIFALVAAGTMIVVGGLVATHSASGAPGGQGNCSDAQYKDEAAPFIITADEGTVIHDVFIKSGEGAFPYNEENDKCSDAITENGVDSTGCYLVQGIGTPIVTVTNIGVEGCHEISHIEANNPPDPTTTETASPTPTATESPTPTATETPSPTPTATEIPSPTATPTATPTETPTPTSTLTPTKELTPTSTSILTPTVTPESTSTSTATPSLTATSSVTPTSTSTPETPAQLPPTGGSLEGDDDFKTGLMVFFGIFTILAIVFLTVIALIASSDDR